MAQNEGNDPENSTAGATDASLPVASKEKRPNRMYYVDYVRTFLTLLVVVHHCMWQLDSFNAANSFGLAYRWLDYPDWGTLMTLEGFLRFNQSYFMGLFFFLAGFFTEPSYMRKGSWKYLQERALRLLVPIVFYELLLSPALFYIAKGVAPPGEPPGLAETDNVYRWYFDRYTSVGRNPMWFVAVLFCFDLIFLATRLITCIGKNQGEGQGSSVSPSSATEPRPFSVKFMVMVTLGLTVVMGSIVLGVRCAVGDAWNINGINFNIAYMSGQYANSYWLGIYARRANALSRIPKVFGYWCLPVGLLWFMVPYSLEWGLRINAGIEMKSEAPGYKAFVSYQEMGTAAFWSVGLLVFAREFWNRPPNVFVRQVVGAAYASYILHPLLVVLFTRALLDVNLHPLEFFAVLSVLVVPSTWLVGVALKNIPGASRVL